MADNSNDLSATQKLEAFLDDIQKPGKTKLPDFTDEEITTLKRVITLVNGLEALGSFAGFIKSTIIWIAVIVGAFIAIKNGAIDFIINTVKNNG
jgi:hypothetical protein